VFDCAAHAVAGGGLALFGGAPDCRWTDRVVAAALLLSLSLSEVAHIRPPVYAQVHLYGAIFAAARIGGLQAGLAALMLALGLSDYFLTEPLHQLFMIDDLPDFLTFGLAAGGSVWIGCLGRRMAEDRQRIEL